MSIHVAALDLSAAEIAELKTAYKQERDRRIAERIHCVVLFAHGHDLRTLKSLLFVGVHTLATWIEAFRAAGLAGLRQWGYQGQAADLTDAQWAEVARELERKPYHCAREVAVWVKAQFKIAYSERGMQALLRRKGYRHIKARLMPGKLPTVAIQEAFVADYEARKAALGPRERLYFVDAVHPTHNVRLSYVWTKKGTRRKIKSNSGRQRYNIMGAYCPSDQEYIGIEVKVTRRSKSAIIAPDQTNQEVSGYGQDGKAFGSPGSAHLSARKRSLSPLWAALARTGLLPVAQDRAAVGRAALRRQSRHRV